MWTHVCVHPSHVWSPRQTYHKDMSSDIITWCIPRVAWMCAFAHACTVGPYQAYGMHWSSIVCDLGSWFWDDALWFWSVINKTMTDWLWSCCVLGQKSSEQQDHCTTIKRVCKPHLPGHIVSGDVLLMLVLAAVRLCDHQLHRACSGRAKHCKLLHVWHHHSIQRREEMQLYSATKTVRWKGCLVFSMLTVHVHISMCQCVSLCRMPNFVKQNPSNTKQIVLFLHSHPTCGWAGFWIETKSQHCLQTCLQLREPWPHCEWWCAAEWCFSAVQQSQALQASSLLTDARV